MTEHTREQEGAVADLLSAMGLMIRRLRTETKSGELTWSQTAILGRLEAGPMTTADLARAESMKPQSMGTALAILEEDGWVQRKPHPSDGRQILYGLTKAGTEMRVRHRAAKRQWVLSALSNLNHKERQTLFAAGGLIRRLAES